MRIFVGAVLLLASSVLSGQQNSGLAVALRTEEYSELSTYPAACFENAWTDSTGRLLIVTCPPEASDGMHMFSFDGYEFRPIRHTLDSLPANSKILAHAGDYTVIGRSGWNNVFVANILTGAIRTIELPEAIGTPAIYAYTEDSILIASTTDNAIALTTWAKGEVSSTYLEYPAPVEDLLPTLWISHSDIWYVDRLEAVVHRIDLATHRDMVFTFDPEITERIKGKRLQFKSYWIDDLPSVRITLGGTYLLLKPDVEHQVFVRMEEMEGEVEDCGVFQDEQGNILVHYKNPGQPHQAIVYRKSGGRMDLTLDISENENADVQAIIGDDFTNALLVRHARGLRSYLVTNTNVIQKSLVGHQIRAMIEVADDRVLVPSGDNFIVDINDPNRTELVDLDCSMSRRKLISLEDGMYAGVNRDGLITFDPETGHCDILVTEVGAVSLAYRYGTSVAMINSDFRLYDYSLTTGSVRPVGQNGNAIQVSGRLHDMAGTDDDLWIATSDGLWQVDPATGSYRIIGRGDPFTDYHFLCIHPDQDGRLWLGTSLGGVQIYDPGTGSVQVLDSRKGLPSNTVVTIQEDHAGDLWVATYDGVALVNRYGSLIRVFDELDGLADNEANRYAGLTTRSGKILVGSINGLSIIDPEEVRKSATLKGQPRIYLTDVQYKTADGSNVSIDRFDLLDGLNEVSLPAAHRSLNLRFALSRYTLAKQNSYQWKFANGSTWKTITGDHVLALDDIPHGTHQLLIRGYDADGTPASNEIRLTIHARRYFFQSWWFYLALGLVITGLAITWIVRLRWAVSRATVKIKEDKRIIEEQSLKLQELNEAKSKYFTEISHEFRTPLTIISGMSAQILDEPDKWTTKGATLIRKNSLRLLKLVNQILDLRKLESSEIQFRMVQGNIVAYLSYLADTFVDYSQTKDIDFSFVPYHDEIMMDYDPDRIADIVSNLVSNAIKFCQAGDQVRLEVESATEGTNEQCVIRLVDTGAGIAEDQLPHIFERFYHVSSDDREVEGTGVGLALVSELVHRLNGQITVDSKLGEGSTFTVRLPISRMSSIEHDVSSAEETQGPSTAVMNDPTAQHTDVSILVVEDSPDLVDYMQTILAGIYTVHVAQNGHLGENMAYELIPDMVISDIMMPGQTGLELCAKLKSDRRTDHIPVILLTAKADRDTKLESLQKGADAFLTKPFDRDELLMIIANLLDQRRQLQLKYAGGSGTEVELHETEPVDAFVAELHRVIDERMEDDDFSVVHLCRAMSMSRTNLHNKIKALTGRSTTGYIRYRRLIKARTLLQQGDLNVSEVAYAVGFKSQSYFSTSYAREFGAPPSATA